jgi:hypothetical protein
MKIGTFFLRFIAFSIVIYLIWYYFLGNSYLFVLAYASKYLLSAIGYNALLVTTEGSPYFVYKGIEIGMKGAHLSNFNIVPLIALILAAPGVALKRRGKMLMVGIPAIFFLHLIDFVSHIPMYFDRSEAAGLIVAFMGVGEVAVPFLIWFALAYREIFPEMKEKEVKTKKKKKVKNN